MQLLYSHSLWQKESELWLLSAADQVFVMKDILTAHAVRDRHSHGDSGLPAAQNPGPYFNRRSQVPAKRRSGSGPAQAARSGPPSVAQALRVPEKFQCPGEQWHNSLAGTGHGGPQWGWAR